MLSTAKLVLSESESDTTDISAPSYSVITPTEESIYDSFDENIEIMHEDQPHNQIPEVPLNTSAEGESDSVSGI